MKRYAPVLLGFTLLMVLAFLACGGSNSHSLQSVSISPAAATSQAQFTATGLYQGSMSGVNITSTATWCIGGTEGVCAGNIAIFATVTAGLAKCDPGAVGTATVLVGQSTSRPNPDEGVQLQPFASAQLTCP